MLYLVFGDDDVRIRDRVQVLLQSVPVSGVIRLSGKDISRGVFSDIVAAQSMFDDRKVVVIEGKFDPTDVDFSFLPGDAATDVIIYVLGGLKRNEKLYKAIESVGGVIEACESEPDKDIFTFLDAIVRKQRKLAMNELKRLFEGGKDPIYIQTMMVWQFRHLLSPELTKGFVQKKAQEIRAHYTEEELVKIYMALYTLEFKLKTGDGVPEGLVEECVVRITK